MTRPLRIAAWVHGLYPQLRAGSEVMLDAMLSALADAGHEVHAVSTLTGPEGPVTEWEHGGYQCYRRQPARPFVEALAPDVVISHHDHAREAISAARAVSAAAVSIIHNDFHLSRAIIRDRPDLLVYNTHWLRRKLPAHGVRNLIVHPPLDKAKHALPGRGPGGAALAVNLYKIKGPEMFWALAGHFRDLPFLAVTGGYGPQDIRTGYDNVELLPTTDDMRRDVWPRGRVYLASSRYESYGLAPAEALAAGIPVIANPTAGLRESLGSGGRWATRANLNRWRQLVHSLMTDDDAWRRAHRAALARADELDAMRGPELARWVDEVGAVGREARRLRERHAPTVTAS
jgi:glycosyltransferase involved in cell wall biosynthesis